MRYEYELDADWKGHTVTLWEYEDDGSGVTRDSTGVWVYGPDGWEPANTWTEEPLPPAEHDEGDLISRVEAVWLQSHYQLDPTAEMEEFYEGADWEDDYTVGLFAKAAGGYFYDGEMHPATRKVMIYFPIAGVVEDEWGTVSVPVDLINNRVEAWETLHPGWTISHLN
tara:strand:- start:786 stop:1289 length:504 start_codon:yes stop_codon:yes gene_type:complete